MKILLIGCGKMGGAIMNGWLKSGISKSDIKIIDPFFKGGLKSIYDLPKSFQPDYVLLAVKPQSLPEVLPELKAFSKATFISIIAGKTIKYIQKQLPDAVIIRTMPNLPALIGQGITAAISSKKLAPKKKGEVTNLLKACGKLVWIEDEKHIDSVTAISGSGPAYVFLFAQGLIEAGIKLGLDEKTAQTLAYETIKGSVALAENSKENLTQLKVNVTSKGGTTEAALKIFEDKDSLKNLILNAAKAAKNRAKELSE